MRKITTILLVLISFAATATQTKILKQEDGDISYIITSPTHKGSNLPLISDQEGDETGVCLYLGYEKFVENSAVYNEEKEHSIVVNSKGITKYGNKEQTIKELVCLNKTGKESLEVSVIVKRSELIHESSKIPLSIKAASNGYALCKYKGYQKYLGAVADPNIITVLILNNDLTVLEMTKHYAIEKLYCLK